MLNRTQIYSLRSCLRLAVDEIVRNGHAKYLHWVVEKPFSDINSLERSISKEYVERILSNVDISPNIRRMWSKIFHCLKRGKKFPKALEEEFNRHPNYNPYNLLDIMKFEKRMKKLNVSSIYLVRLREMFLEMTPKSSYSYDGIFHFQFRQGKYPLNLHTLGPTPNEGLVRNFVEFFVEDFLENKVEEDEKIVRQQERREQTEKDFKIALKLQKEEETTHFDSKRDRLKRKCHRNIRKFNQDLERLISTGHLHKKKRRELQNDFSSVLFNHTRILNSMLPQRNAGGRNRRKLRKINTSHLSRTPVVPKVRKTKSTFLPKRNENEERKGVVRRSCMIRRNYLRPTSASTWRRKLSRKKLENLRREKEKKVMEKSKIVRRNRRIRMNRKRQKGSFEHSLKFRRDYRKQNGVPFI